MSMSKHPPLRSAAGFTLLELMIAVAIVAILGAIAWPTFESAVRKSRRSDGTAALTRVMQAQERYRANNSSFGATLAAIGVASNQSANGYYTVGIVEGSANASQYSLTATVNSNTPQGADSECAVLTLQVRSGNIFYGSTNRAGDANATDPCWPK